MRSVLSIPISLLILLSSFTQVALAQDFFVFPRQGKATNRCKGTRWSARSGPGSRRALTPCRPLRPRRRRRRPQGRS